MLDRMPAYGSKADGGLRCPRCRAGVVRIRRRTFDRLVSLFSPRQRFRCAAFGCGWEGTLRVKR
jgi:transposase-like protein